jgi:hypothetical protein
MGVHVQGKLQKVTQRLKAKLCGVKGVNDQLKEKRKDSPAVNRAGRINIDKDSSKANRKQGFPLSLQQL